MKWNWGTGIFVFYSLFALSLFVQVYHSTQYDHSLVAKDYYAKDIAYQKMYDKKQNSLSLAQPLIFDLSPSEQQLQIHFPKKLDQPAGVVTFYNPQRAQDDWQLPLRTDAKGSMIIPVQHLQTGRWRVQVDWQAKGKSYFDEKDLFISNPS